MVAQKLTPDFKTIADFRKDNLQPLRNVCRAVTLLCKDLDLFGGELVAIDGSKFRAVNNRTRNFTSKKLERTLLEIDTKIAAYLSELDTQVPSGRRGEQSGRLPEKIAALQGRREQYLLYQQALALSGASQLSLTDPDCRCMPVAQGTLVGYNAQMAVDAKNKLIVDHELTTAVTDQHQLSTLAVGAKQTLGVESLEVVADVGYYDGEEVKACLEMEITPFVAKPHTSRNQKHGLFTKADFIYDANQDTYGCPARAILTYRFSTVEDG